MVKFIFVQYSRIKQRLFFSSKSLKKTVIKRKVIIIVAGAGSFGPNKLPLANIERRIWKQVCFVCFFFFICNHSIFAGKNIFIAGGGHSAADWDISLSEIANKINLAYKRN